MGGGEMDARMHHNYSVGDTHCSFKTFNGPHVSGLLLRSLFLLS